MARCLANHFNKTIYLARYHNDTQAVTAMKVSPDINTQPVNCPLKDIPRDAEYILLFNGINHYWKVMPTELFEVDDDDDDTQEIDDDDATQEDNVTSTANSFFNKRQADIEQYEKTFPHLKNVKQLFDMNEKTIELELQQKGVHFTITDHISNKRRKLAEHRNNPTLQLAPVFTPQSKSSFVKKSSFNRHKRDTEKHNAGQSSVNPRLNSYKPQKLASDKTLRRRKQEAKYLITILVIYFLIQSP